MRLYSKLREMILLRQITPNVVVCFLIGNSSASELYIPTFRNTLLHLHRQVGISSYLPAYEDGTVFRNVGI